MTRIAYVNGRFVEARSATVPMEDRGYHFADGVYEYIAFYNRRLLDARPHLQRLERSLKELRIPRPMPVSAILRLMEKLIRRNSLNDGAVYLQITRGAAKRDHAFPKNARPVLTMALYPPKTPKPHELREGARVITHPDERWKRCDIKSISLLANVLARQAAVEAGAREAWLFLPDGKVTEGTACNTYIVNAKGTVMTHPADHHILAGITRRRVLELARKAGICVEERPFTVKEAKAAKEAFLTSTSPNVLPVVKIDSARIGSGRPGPVTKRLMEIYFAHIKRQTGKAFP